MGKIIQLKRKAQKLQVVKSQPQTNKKAKQGKSHKTQPEKNKTEVSAAVTMWARYLNMQTRLDDLDNTYKKACLKDWTDVEKKDLKHIYDENVSRLNQIKS